MVNLVKIIHLVLLQVVLTYIVVMSDYRLEHVIQIRFFVKVFKQRHVIKQNKGFNHVVVLINTIHHYITTTIGEYFLIDSVCVFIVITAVRCIGIRRVCIRCIAIRCIATIRGVIINSGGVIINITIVIKIGYESPVITRIRKTHRCC